MNLDQRISNLEKADPPAMPPLILFLRGITEARCAELNARRDPRNNPLTLIVRPCPDEVQP